MLQTTRSSPSPCRRDEANFGRRRPNTKLSRRSSSQRGTVQRDRPMSPTFHLCLACRIHSQAEDQQAINAAIDTLRQRLPFLIDLTVAQRREMPKAADKTRAFVQKAVEVANEHSQMFPAAFLEELRKDWQLLGSLSPITLAIPNTGQEAGRHYAAT